MTHAPADLEKVLAVFQDLQSATREMIGVDRVELMSPDAPERGLAWLILFRALNLAEAAILTGNQRYGEALGLITRSMEELAYLVGYLGKDLQKAAEFYEGSAAKHVSDLEKRAKHFETADPSIKASMDKGIRGYRKLLTCNPVAWAETVCKRAEAAGMLNDYKLHYYVFSDNAHHGHRAFDFYVTQFRDGLQIEQKVSEGHTTIFLVYAAIYFSGILLPMLDFLHLPRTHRFRRALKNYIEVIGE
jgi:hypothetical protein